VACTPSGACHTRREDEASSFFGLINKPVYSQSVLTVCDQ